MQNCYALLGDACGCRKFIWHPPAINKMLDQWLFLPSVMCLVSHGILNLCEFNSPVFSPFMYLNFTVSYDREL